MRVIRPGRRDRDRRGLAPRDRAHRRAGRPRALAPEAARARPHGARARERRAARRLRPGRHAAATPDVILIGSGSEVHDLLAARETLGGEGVAARVVSLPDWNLFLAQPQSYRDEVLPREVWRRVSLEAGATFGWPALVGDRGTALGLDRYGASAPAPDDRARARHHARGGRRGGARAAPAVSEGPTLTSWGVCGVFCAWTREVPVNISGEREVSPPPHPTEERDAAEPKLLVIAVIAARRRRACSARRTSGSGNGWKVVASGLDNPRGIDVAKNGDIWIAEAGKGGAGPCQSPVPRAARIAAQRASATSGAFTRRPQRLAEARRHAVCRRSATQGTGDNAIGPSDIVADGKHVTGLIGGGGNARRARRRSAAAGALFDWMVKIDPWKGKVWPFADFVAVRGRQQPGQGRDRLRRVRPRPAPRRLRRRGRGRQRRARRRATRSTSRRWPCSRTCRSTLRRSSACPAGTKIPMQAVPTTVAVRPKDPNVYVGQLTGFPFPPGAASVWAHQAGRLDVRVRLRASRTSSTSRGARRARSTCSRSRRNGLLSGDPDRRAHHASGRTASKTIVASDGLVTPTGVAIGKDGSVYVTNYGTSAGKGTVVNLGKV